MVSGQQYLWHHPPPELSGTGVVGLFEQSVAEAFARKRLRVPNDTGQQSGDSLDDGEGGHLATEENVVAD